MKLVYVLLFISIIYSQDRFKNNLQQSEIINMGKKTWPINQSNNFRSNNIGLDTLENLAYNNNDEWWGGFGGYAGDAFLMLHQMPSDGTIKGVNVPIYNWYDDHELTISIHRVSYPNRSDDESYPLSIRNYDGWTGGYDMDENGNMSFTGTNYSAGGTQGICDPYDSVAYGAIDPLGYENGSGPSDVPMMGLVWPEGTTTGTTTLDSASNPAGNDNWIDLTDAGSEVTFSEGEWIGILVQVGNGSQNSYTQFYYRHAAGPPTWGPNHNLPPHWVFTKFYAGCGGTSGNGGWHIRDYMIKTQLAVERSGDDPPVVISMTEPVSSLDQDDRYFSAVVTDENFDDNSSGVASVSFNYYLNSTDNPSNQISMTQTAEANTWDCSITGQPANTDVYWYLTATDVNGNTTVTDTNQYTVLFSVFELPIPYDITTAGFGVIEVDSIVYFVGGRNYSTGYVDSVLSYSLFTHTWSVLSNMNEPREDLGLLHINGKLYAIGGSGNNSWGTHSFVEEYDIANNSWSILIDGTGFDNNSSPIGSGYDGRNQEYFTECNGKLYSVSTSASNGGNLKLYESDDGINWTTHEADVGNAHHPTLVASETKVYMIGGDVGDNPDYFKEFDPVSHTFTDLAPHSYRLYGRYHTIYNGGNIFKFSYWANPDSLEMYNINSNTWYQLPYSDMWSKYHFKINENNDYFLFNDDNMLAGRIFPLDSIAGIPFNDAPLKAELIYPTAQDTFSTHTDSDSLIVFQWHPSIDGDNDAVSYSLTIELEFFGNLYTDFYDDITDTTLGISSNSLDPILSATGQEEAMFSYFIVASDGQESTMSDTGMFVLSRAALSTIENRLLPERFSLHQNYPNPFNPITTLRYDLPENNMVNITIYDMMGREVRTLVNQVEDAGYRSIIWDATNKYGKPVSAGIYLYQIQAGEYIQTKKMILLK